MLQFKFNEDYACNWRAGQIVPCESMEGGYLVDGVALVPKDELNKHGMFYEEESAVYKEKSIVSRKGFRQECVPYGDEGRYRVLSYDLKTGCLCIEDIYNSDGKPMACKSYKNGHLRSFAILNPDDNRTILHKTNFNEDGTVAAYIEYREDSKYEINFDALGNITETRKYGFKRSAKKKLSLNGVIRVTMRDYSDYDSEKCHDGGHYGFWVDYDRLANGKWEVSYGTTADIEYCPCCGRFADHYVGDSCHYDSGYSCGEYQTITETELLKLINNFKEVDGKSIEYQMLNKMKEGGTKSGSVEDFKKYWKI